MDHPFYKITPDQRKPLLLFLLLTTTSLLITLNIFGLPLKTSEAPSGIISYEIAGSIERAQAIIDSWNQNEQIVAGFHLGLDYLFLFIYPTTIAFILVWTSETIRSTSWLARHLLVMAWMMFLAVIVDALENAILLFMLLFEPLAPWPLIAKWSALLKFGIVILGLISVVLGLIMIIRRPNETNQ